MADEMAAREAADAVRGAFPAPSAQVLERVEAVITAAARERVAGASPVTVLEPRRRAPAVLRAAACLLVVVLVLPTATAATAQTLPGDAWHPLQVVLERLWVTAAPGGLASARVELRLADRRLLAADRAVDAGRTDAVPLLLALFHRHLEDAERLGGASVAAEVSALRIRAASHLAPGVAEEAEEAGRRADRRPPVGRDAGAPIERPPAPVPSLRPPATTPDAASPPVLRAPAAPAATAPTAPASGPPAPSTANGSPPPAADAGAGGAQPRTQPAARPSSPPEPSPSQPASPRRDPVPIDEGPREEKPVVPPPAPPPTERDDGAGDRADDEPGLRGDAGAGRESEPHEDPEDEYPEDSSAVGGDDGDDRDGGE